MILINSCSYFLVVCCVIRASLHLQQTLLLCESAGSAERLSTPTVLVCLPLRPAARRHILGARSLRGAASSATYVRVTADRISERNAKQRLRRGDA